MLKHKLFILILFVTMGFGIQVSPSIAGVPGPQGFINEDASHILVSYFDIANGNSFVQVTNTDSVNSVTIHVQIFADLNNCVDRDFNDSLTPNETHIYDISNLQSANGNPINFLIPQGSHGFVVISAGNTSGLAFSLLGNFRIVRNSGYEYRVNSASSRQPNGLFLTQDFVARFTNDWGANQADIVGVRVVSDPNGAGILADGTQDLSVQITDPYGLFIFDDEETGTSCGEAQFGCDERPGDNDDGIGDGVDLPSFTADFINQGINDTFPNSRGGGVLCSGDFNTDGYVSLNQTANPENLRDLVGFVGLNDGAGRGSMDRFKNTTVLAMMASCGDSIVGNTSGETCDPPGSAAGANGNTCRDDCTVCGDGFLDSGETCDDGNSDDNDSCSNLCLFNVE